MTLPALFLAHGTPINAISENSFTRDWQQLAAGLPRPRAILCISAHWCTRGSWLTAQARPPTIHDFRGFPQALFDIDYPCPGDPSLAAEIAAGISFAPIGLSNDWGLDHGSWSLLLHLFPQADIPVLQLSLDIQQAPAFHFALGQVMSVLREQGVLVIGSGNIVHNIAKWLQDPHGPFEWGRRFDQRIAEALRNEDNDTLINYARLADAQDAVPTPEHYLPLLYIAGMRKPGESLSMSNFAASSLENCSMRSLRIGAA